MNTNRAPRTQKGELPICLSGHSLCGLEDVEHVVVRLQRAQREIATLGIASLLHAAQELLARVLEDRVHDDVAIGRALFDERQQHARAVLDPTLLWLQLAARLIHDL